MTESDSTAARLREVFAVFLKLGVTSFGGPVAHLGYLHEEFVRRRRWLDEHDFADLVALCQFLPGPASSQVVFALGLRRAGLPGALVASLCFTLPSAALMMAFAYGVLNLGRLGNAGWLQGLKVAAVAVVAQAVLVMARTLCPDRVRGTLAVGAAAIVLWLGSAWSQIAALAAGAAAGWWLFRHQTDSPRPAAADAHPSRAAMAWGGSALLLWLLLLALLPIWAHAHAKGAGAVFDSFFRAGSLVFGGGHVVLPLLRAEVVPPGWITDDAFLAGYGAAQAVPGPLFTFAAYLGTMLRAGPGGLVGGLWALLAIFLPAWLLIGGALPFWDRLRAMRPLRAALQGTNAAVVGILLAALYQPVWLEGIQSARHFALGTAAFVGLVLWRAPAWAIVVAAALVGVVLF